MFPYRLISMTQNEFLLYRKNKILKMTNFKDDDFQDKEV